MPAAEAMPQVYAPATYQRWLFHAAWILGTVVFLFIGTLSLEPTDPRGPVSLLAHGDPGSMLIEILALAVVISGLATALAGRSHPEIGAFAVCVGLALVSLHGDTMTYLLMSFGDTRVLCLSLVGESLFWSLAVALASITSALVVRWLGASRADGGAWRAELAVAAVPLLGRLLLGPGADQRRDSWSAGLKHLAVATVVALLLIAVLSTGRGDRAIRHGQAFFAVAAALYLGANRAQTYFPARSLLWSMGAAPAVCLIAYAYAGVRPGPSLLVDGLATVPVSNFLRILPITYVTVGVAAALLARWRWHQRHQPSEAGGR